MPAAQQASNTTKDYESKPLVSRLPPDIYKEIIKTIMTMQEYQHRGPRGKKQLVLLSHISSPFRHAALDCPSLWSSVLYPEDPHPTAFEDIYARTKDAPLQVDSELCKEYEPDSDSELNRQSNARIKKLLTQTHRLSHLGLDWLSAKDDLPFILDALAKPVPQLSHVRLCNIASFGTPIHCLQLRKRLFEERSVSRCSLRLRDCNIDPTLVCLPKLVQLNVTLSPSSRYSNTLPLLLQWWGIVTDGISTQALEELEMGYFNLGDPSDADLDVTATTGFSGRRSFPAHLKKLKLEGTLNSYIRLLDDNPPLPESCRSLVLKCDGVHTDPTDAFKIEHIAKKLSGLVAGVWKNSHEATAASTTTTLCPRTNLRISGKCHEELALTFSSGFDRNDAEAYYRYSSLSFRDCGRADHLNNVNRLALFTKGALQVNIPKLTPDAWLDMYSQYSPDFALHIHDAYIGFLRHFDGLKNLHLKCSSPLPPLTVQVGSESRLTPSSSSNSNPLGATVLLPNLQHVRLEHWWLCDPAAVSAFNQFGAARTRLGLPIPRVEVRMMHRSAPDRDIVVHRPLELGKLTPVKVQPDGRVTTDKLINLFEDLNMSDEYTL